MSGFVALRKHPKGFLIVTCSGFLFSIFCVLSIYLIIFIYTFDWLNGTARTRVTL